MPDPFQRPGDDPAVTIAREDPPRRPKFVVGSGTSPPGTGEGGPLNIVGDATIDAAHEWWSRHSPIPSPVEHPSRPTLGGTPGAIQRGHIRGEPQFILPGGPDTPAFPEPTPEEAKANLLQIGKARELGEKWSREGGEIIPLPDIVRSIGSHNPLDWDTQLAKTIGMYTSHPEYQRLSKSDRGDILDTVNRVFARGKAMSADRVRRVAEGEDELSVRRLGDKTRDNPFAQNDPFYRQNEDLYALAREFAGAAEDDTRVDDLIKEIPEDRRVAFLQILGETAEPTRRAADVKIFDGWLRGSKGIITNLLAIERELDPMEAPFGFTKEEEQKFIDDMTGQRNALRFLDKVHQVRLGADPIGSDNAFFDAFLTAEQAAPPMIAAMIMPGGKVGKVAFWMAQIFPDVHRSLLDADIDEDIALPMAIFISFGSAGIETLQTERLTPGGRKVAVDMFAKMIPEIVKSLTIRYGANIAIEMTQEGAQEITELVGKRIAEEMQRYYANDPNFKGFDWDAEIEQSMERWAEFWPAMAFLALPGAMVDASSIPLSIRNNGQAVARWLDERAQLQERWAQIITQNAIVTPMAKAGVQPTPSLVKAAEALDEEEAPTAPAEAPAPAAEPETPVEGAEIAPEPEVAEGAVEDVTEVPTAEFMEEPADADPRILGRIRQGDLMREAAILRGKRKPTAGEKARIAEIEGVLQEDVAARTELMRAKIEAETKAELARIAEAFGEEPAPVAPAALPAEAPLAGVPEADVEEAVTDRLNPPFGPSPDLNPEIVAFIKDALGKGTGVEVRTGQRITPLSDPEHIRVAKDGTVQTRERGTWVTLFQGQVGELARQAGFPTTEAQPTPQEAVAAPEPPAEAVVAEEAPAVTTEPEVAAEAKPADAVALPELSAEVQDEIEELSAELRTIPQLEPTPDEERRFDAIVERMERLDPDHEERGRRAAAAFRAETEARAARTEREADPADRFGNLSDEAKAAAQRLQDELFGPDVTLTAGVDPVRAARLIRLAAFHAENAVRGAIKTVGEFIRSFRGANPEMGEINDKTLTKVFVEAHTRHVQALPDNPEARTEIAEFLRQQGKSRRAEGKDRSAAAFAVAMKAVRDPERTPGDVSQYNVTDWKTIKGIDKIADIIVNRRTGLVEDVPPAETFPETPGAPAPIAAPTVAEAPEPTPPRSTAVVPQADRPEKIGGKRPITERTERNVQKLIASLSAQGKLTEDDYNQHLAAIGLKADPRFISKKDFATERDAQALIERINDGAEMAADILAEDIGLSQENNEWLEGGIETIKQSIARKVVDLGNVTASAFVAARDFFIALEEKTGKPFHRISEYIRRDERVINGWKEKYHRDLAQAWGTPGTRLRRAGVWLRGGSYASFIRDKPAMQRVSDEIASKAAGSEIESPPDITEREMRMVRVHEDLLESMKHPFLFNRVKQWITDPENTDIPDAPIAELERARDIYETQGNEALSDFLRDKTFGTLDVGYEKGEWLERALSFVPPKITGFGRTHVREAPPEKRKKNIVQRTDTYLGWVLNNRLMSPHVRNMKRLYDENNEVFRRGHKGEENAAQIEAGIVTYINEAKGYGDPHDPLAKPVLAIYRRGAAAIFLNPALAARNRLQNPAMNEDVLWIAAHPQVWGDLVAEWEPGAREHFDLIVDDPKGFRRDFMMQGHDGGFDPDKIAGRVGNIPGKALDALTVLANRFPIYTWSHQANLLDAYAMRQARVKYALGKVPRVDGKLAFTSEKIVRKLIRQSGLEAQGETQMRRALQILAKDGEQAFNNYVSELQAEAVHFNYLRSQRSQAERGNIGKILGSLLTFPSRYAIRAGREVKTVIRPGVYQSRLNALARFIQLTVIAGEVGSLFAFGLGRKKNPFWALDILGWEFGGLATGLLNDLTKVIKHTLYPAMLGDDAAQNRAPAAIAGILRTFVPGLQIIRNILNAGLDLDDTDQIFIGEMLGLYDEDYKVDREAKKNTRNVFNQFVEAFLGASKGTADFQHDFDTILGRLANAEGDEKIKLFRLARDAAERAGLSPEEFDIALARAEAKVLNKRAEEEAKLELRAIERAEDQR